MKDCDLSFDLLLFFYIACCETSSQSWVIPECSARLIIAVTQLPLRLRCGRNSSYQAAASGIGFRPTSSLTQTCTQKCAHTHTRTPCVWARPEGPTESDGRCKKESDRVRHLSVSEWDFPNSADEEHSCSYTHTHTHSSTPAPGGIWWERCPCLSRSAFVCWAWLWFMVDLNTTAG